MYKQQLCLILLLIAAGCQRDGTKPPRATGNRSPVENRDGDRSERGATPSNLMQVSKRIYCGGQPRKDKDFATLAELGINTLVSVDGARPDVELARKHGLRYIHIPIGYDGIPEKAGKALARLVREAEGPFYIHCHHGRHRGPAAAAVACIVSGDRTPQEALAVLQEAGTSRDYAGLWRDVEAYRAPPPDAELPELVEVAQVGSLAAAMATIDRSRDNLELCRQAGWRAPRSHPDLVAVREALIIREELHEIGRNLAGDYDQQFNARLAEAEARAKRLEDALRAERYKEADTHLQRLRASCRRCHADYRD